MEPMHSSPNHANDSEAPARLKRFKEYSVSHPLLQQVDRQLTRAIEEPAGFAYVLVPGPSGVGKTTIIRQIEQRNSRISDLICCIIPNVSVEPRTTLFNTVVGYGDTPTRWSSVQPSRLLSNGTQIVRDTDL